MVVFSPIRWTITLANTAFALKAPRNSILRVIFRQVPLILGSTEWGGIMMLTKDWASA
ncbi:hypothetical protein N9L47_09435 [Rhodobacteraceae bacterium]|nr:hypothetical protein [Paracoccaceae bacterium]